MGVECLFSLRPLLFDAMDGQERYSGTLPRRQSSAILFSAARLKASALLVFPKLARTVLWFVARPPIFFADEDGATARPVRLSWL